MKYYRILCNGVLSDPIATLSEAFAYAEEVNGTILQYKVQE